MSAGLEGCWTLRLAGAAACIVLSTPGQQATTERCFSGPVQAFISHEFQSGDTDSSPAASLQAQHAVILELSL